MTYEDKVEGLIIQQLQEGKLLDIAAYAVRVGLAQGYCEFVEHKELWKLIKPYVCLFCGRMHRSKLHDELTKLWDDDGAYAAAHKKANMKYSFASPSFEIASQHPGFPMELFNDPQEYTPN